MSDCAQESIIIRATPEEIFDVITDYESYPKWAAQIKEVEVLRADESGKAGLVTFRAAAMGRSATYVLEYFYGDNPLRVSWRLTEGDLVRRLDGSYRITAVEEDELGPRSEVQYELQVDVTTLLPGFIRRRAETSILKSALQELSSWVEKGEPDADINRGSHELPPF